jgi:GR25 family glycosyltransferase involved in LPS biosynthesis
MNILNKTFDKIYIIGSFATQSRYNDLHNKLNKEKIDVEWVIAPKKKYFLQHWTVESPNLPGNWSHQSAFESIFLKSKAIGLNNFLILEDDVIFDEHYINKFQTFYSSIPDDWQILNMGYHFHSIHVDADIYYKFNHDGYLIGTHANAYKNDTFNIILDEFEKCTCPVDIFLSNNVYKKLNTYASTEKIFYQSSYRSYESDKDANYKKYLSEIDSKN